MEREHLLPLHQCHLLGGIGASESGRRTTIVSRGNSTGIALISMIPRNQYCIPRVQKLEDLIQ